MEWDRMIITFNYLCGVLRFHPLIVSLLFFCCDFRRRCWSPRRRSPQPAGLLVLSRAECGCLFVGFECGWWMRWQLSGDANSISSLCPNRGSNNLSLSSFLWLDFIVDQLHLLENLSTNLSWSLSTIWLLPSCVSKFRMRNTILAPRWIVLSSTTFLPPPNTNLFIFCVVSWFPCYPTYVMFYRGVLPSLMSRMSWALLHLLRILGTVILLTITILSWSPCCF